MRRALLSLALVALLAVPARAGVITVINNDGVNEGFNDTTPAAPVGGNPGTTLGQQRFNVFQHAADIWGTILPSTVTIRIQARFDPLSCTSTTAVLGSAGPIEVFRDFPGAPFAGTWYHVALANKLTGSDLSAGVNDITAQFNVSLDNATCLGATSWYYGFDSNEGSNVELLPVVLHEMGHGLGFSTLVNLGNGAESGGFPDVFEKYIYDNTAGNSWENMTPTERVNSAVNTTHVVWNGPLTTQASPNYLGPTPGLTVNAGSGLPPKLAIGQASFGPPISSPGITANLVLADDGVAPGSDGCSAIVNSVAGKIALVDRGTCTFVAKAQAVEAAGAVACIIADNVAGGAPPGLGGSGVVNIPTVSVTLADGNALKAALGSGTVNLTLGLDANDLAGADALGRVQLYAPNPVASGSSISHFDIDALPDLLMEPFINGSLTDDVDLTRYLFADIGWLGELAAAPPEGLPVTPRLAAVPNPFRSSTVLSFELAAAGPVSLDVFDLTGRLVRQLVDGVLPASRHTVTWDGSDDAGRPVAAGIYLTRLSAREGVETSRVVLVP